MLPTCWHFLMAQEGKRTVVPVARFAAKLMELDVSKKLSSFDNSCFPDNFYGNILRKYCYPNGNNFPTRKFRARSLILGSRSRRARICTADMRPRAKSLCPQPKIVESSKGRLTQQKVGKAKIQTNHEANEKRAVINHTNTSREQSYVLSGNRPPEARHWTTRHNVTSLVTTFDAWPERDSKHTGQRSVPRHRARAPS